MISCSIIIPVYNRAFLTQQCLEALSAQRDTLPACEIIVVDDASTDDTQTLLASFPGLVRVIIQEQNGGFAVACNRGAESASGRFLIFLNNDTLPVAGWLEALVGYAEQHPSAAAVGAKLLFPNNTIQHAGVVICQDRIPRHLYMGFPGDHPAVNKSRRFQVVTGACLLVRADAFEQSGGFNTDFANGYEDVDLCLRLGEQGYEVHYCHESVLQHLESVSRNAHSKQQRANFRLYWQRWGEHVQPDDIQYYLEDGMIRMTYEASHLTRLGVSADFAILEEEQRSRQADELLAQRSRQVFDLLRENIRLQLDLQEARGRLQSFTQEAPVAFPSPPGETQAPEVALPAA